MTPLSSTLGWNFTYVQFLSNMSHFDAVFMMSDFDVFNPILLFLILNEIVVLI